MLRLALIFGGRSAEHEISLASARFVSSMLHRDEYEVTPVGMVGYVWELSGRWGISYRATAFTPATPASGRTGGGGAAFTCGFPPS